MQTRKQMYLCVVFVLMLWLVPVTAWGASDNLHDLRWSQGKAWAWYAEVGQILGCNYLPRTAVNVTDIWQDESFDPKIIDEELGWAQKAGYNSLRVFVQYAVWEEDAEALRQRIDQFLTIADRHGMRVMLVLFDDSSSLGREPYIGKQNELVPSLYNSGGVPAPGHQRVNDCPAWPDLERYIKDLIGHFHNDRRILIWDLYNKPEMSGQDDKSLSLVKAAFRWARQAEPTQPLTAGAYSVNMEDSMSKTTMELSDVISFRSYGSSEAVSNTINICRRYNRPILCTEWLDRGLNNRFETILPIFAKERVGSYHRGLVAGQTQTHRPWDSKKGDPMPKVWSHNVFHPDGAPYDPNEIELIRNFKYWDGDIPKDFAGKIYAVPAGDAIFSEDKDGVDFFFTIEHAPAATHLYY